MKKDPKTFDTVSPVFCLGCKEGMQRDDRVNKPWAGWDAAGKTKQVDNHCCPFCGSNDLLYRR